MSPYWGACDNKAQWDKFYYWCLSFTLVSHECDNHYAKQKDPKQYKLISQYKDTEAVVKGKISDISIFFGFHLYYDIYSQITWFEQAFTL